MPAGVGSGRQAWDRRTGEAMTSLPAVSVVVPTHGRPKLLAAAVDAVLAQEYPGPVECVVVYDQTEPDHSIASRGRTRRVVVLANARTPGLAGARNTGALAAQGEVLAFCDDDDQWLPGKLSAQLERMRESGADVVASGIMIASGDKLILRVPSKDELTVQDLARRRAMEAHPSTVVVRRDAFVDRIGLVDEQIPGSYGEDYDWMLRAATLRPIAIVPRPLVRVLWGRTSFFNRRWRTIAEALQYLVGKHAVLREDPRGLARIYGQIAFAYAALGERRQARSWASRALRLSWRERRGYLAALISFRVLSAEQVLKLAHSRGRGI